MCIFSHWKFQPMASLACAWSVHTPWSKVPHTPWSTVPPEPLCHIHIDDPSCQNIAALISKPSSSRRRYDSTAPFHSFMAGPAHHWQKDFKKNPLCAGCSDITFILSAVLQPFLLQSIVLQETQLALTFMSFYIPIFHFPMSPSHELHWQLQHLDTSTFCDLFSVFSNLFLLAACCMLYAVS